MPTMSQKTTTYTYDLAELTKLIAADLQVPVAAVDVRYNLHDTSDDRFSHGSPSYSVRDVTVTVDMKKVESASADGHQHRGPYAGR